MASSGHFLRLSFSPFIFMFIFKQHSLAALVLLSFTSSLLAQDAAPSAESLSRGQTVYMQVCFACHQPTGLGLPGMFPPLAGSDWAAAKKPDRMIRMVLHGFTGPFTLNGKPFTSPAPLMPPQGSALSDTQIADVLTFVRNSFGNKASAVAPDQVKAIREAEKARSAMWTEAELQKIPGE
jgi:mono/diheme cytochrome c family protein